MKCAGYFVQKSKDVELKCEIAVSPENVSMKTAMCLRMIILLLNLHIWLTFF